MTGFIFAIIAAILFAGKEGFSKKLTQHSGVFFILWAATLIALPIFFIGLVIQGIPDISPAFWVTLAFAAPMFFSASLLLIKAEKISPLSLTLPFLSFSPVFMILTSWLILGEVPSWYGAIGICLIPIGAFMINANKIKQGWLAPIKAITKEKGSLYALIVAAIWSVSSNIDKIAINNSSVFFYLFTINLLIYLVLTIILTQRHKTNVGQEFKKYLKYILPLGLSYGIAVSFQMMAIQQILVPYVIAIKRGGVIIGGIIIGALIFREKDIKQRLLGGIIMTIGILIIILFP